MMRSQSSARGARGKIVWSCGKVSCKSRSHGSDAVSGPPRLLNGAFKYRRSSSARSMMWPSASITLVFAMIYLPQQVKLQFVRQHDAVAKRQQHIFYSRVVLNSPIQCANDARIFFDRIEHPPVAQHIVEHDQPAFAGQVHATIVIIIVTRLIGVDEAEIEGSAQRLQSIRRAPGSNFDLTPMGALGKKSAANFDRMRVKFARDNAAIRR